MALVLGAAADGMPPAAADPAADAVIARVEKRLYHPADHGLRDYSADVETDLLQDMGEGATVKLRCYWKTPSRWRARFEGRNIETLPESARPFVTSAERRVRGYALSAIPEKISDAKGDYTWTVESEAGLTKLVARRRPDAKAAARADETVYWVDGDDRLTRVVSRKSGVTSEATLTYIEKEGVLLRDTQTVRFAGQPSDAAAMVIRCEYEKVGKLWLVSRLRYTIEGRAAVLAFVNPQVNAGVEEAVFEDGGGR